MLTITVLGSIASRFILTPIYSLRMTALFYLISYLQQIGLMMLVLNNKLNVRLFDIWSAFSHDALPMYLNPRDV